MCDYSLHHLASRPAKVGDKLVSTAFANSFTRGFATVGDPTVAVCVLPGTELAFDDDVVYEPDPHLLFGSRTILHRVARFRQVNLDRPHAHHDALEFPNGQTVLVTRLAPGQAVTVLQLPASTAPAKAAEQIPARPMPVAMFAE
jgi:hypothetical protein